MIVKFQIAGGCEEGIRDAIKQKVARKRIHESILQKVLIRFRGKGTFALYWNGDALRLCVGSSFNHCSQLVSPGEKVHGYVVGNFYVGADYAYEVYDYDLIARKDLEEWLSQARTELRRLLEDPKVVMLEHLYRASGFS